VRGSASSRLQRIARSRLYWGGGRRRRGGRASRRARDTHRAS
jgi:hypothetical protein